MDDILEKINTALEKETGNSYSVYSDMCPSMAILTKSVLEKFSIEENIKSFKSLFDIESITNETDRDDIAMKNRFMAVLFDFVDGVNNNDIWKKVPGMGILLLSKESSCLIKAEIVDGDMQFSFLKSDISPILSERVRNQGNLNLMKINNKNDFLSSLKIIEHGYDISDLYHLIQENTPEVNENGREKVNKAISALSI